MRFNTRRKREQCRKGMIKEMVRQGYMFNNYAEEVVDTWIENGSAGITSKIVGEALRLAKINYVYHLKPRKFP